uniref:TLC ATP/ADP transporter n=1 Tax=Cajanus cajan TaxID=3821 RepID=A0A151TYL0_CAJCA|nr:hypothetical protein KK1_004683 [Cajanus cajan]
MGRSTFDVVVSVFVTVHPHETSALFHSFFCFFFILSAYFVVLPLRDEGAISLGLSNLPGLFVGSLVLTLVAAPFSSLIFSFPNLSKAKALFLIHRFFSVSLILFFILWHSSSAEYSKSNMTGSTPLLHDHGSLTSSFGWDNHGWFYISVRIGLFLWVALLNLITISSTWARVIDVMDTESGSRLFGFIGAGATLGQLFGSLFAIGMAFVGPFLLLFAALLMELAAQTSRGINFGSSHVEEQSSPISPRYNILVLHSRSSLPPQCLFHGSPPPRDSSAHASPPSSDSSACLTSFARHLRATPPRAHHLVRATPSRATPPRETSVRASSALCASFSSASPPLLFFF